MLLEDMFELFSPLGGRDRVIRNHGINRRVVPTAVGAYAACTATRVEGLGSNLLTIPKPP